MRGAFSPSVTILFYISLYENYLLVFFSAVERDLLAVRKILSLFEQATWLSANYAKIQVFPVNCSTDQINLIRSTLFRLIADFSCSYLDLPLSHSKATQGLGVDHSA
jgi:hypothetical protein